MPFNQKLILASTSPRRAALLCSAGIIFDVVGLPLCEVIEHLREFQSGNAVTK